jgi:hypothetical protein
MKEKYNKTLILISCCVSLALILGIIFVFNAGKTGTIQSESLVTPTSVPSATVTPTSIPSATVSLPESDVPTPLLATSTPEPDTSPNPVPSPLESELVVLSPDLGRTGGHWIDLNLSDGNTRLMEDRTIIKTIPSAWGYGIPGTADDYYSTPPDLYFVYEKHDELHYDPTYSGGYFRGWVGFDPERANGFHSFILDSQEKVIDDRLGSISHGCVRLEDWRSLYDFAQVGMPVVVHGESRGIGTQQPQGN